jgi:hypothetical protein
MTSLLVETGRRTWLRFARGIGACVAGACIAVFADGNAFAQTSGKIPDFSTNSSFSWQRLRADGGSAQYGDGWLDPPAGMRGPIREHPDYPLRGNSARGRGEQTTVAIGNHMDPILKPWAAEQMRISNEEVLSGKRGMPFLAASRCYPGGVPGQLLWTAQRMSIAQTANMVRFMWQRDALTRRIYLTDKHSENVKPSWFGESIGRYENGELIVDTIGLSTRLSFLDMFRTPHTEKLHVVERFKLSADGRFLEALVKVEDEDTFNEPMYMTARWRKQNGPWEEFICAENNADHFSHNLFPMPEATRPDF